MLQELVVAVDEAPPVGWTELITARVNFQDNPGTKLYKTEEDLVKDVLNDLRTGKIHDVLKDELRLCPLDSPAGIKFQAAMEALASRFAKDWDVAKRPIKFFLMDHAGMNACQVRGADPPLIGFTRGCFVSLPGEDGKICESFDFLDQVAEFLAHEGVHLVIEGRYSPQKITKGEEALAIGAAVEAVHDAGFDVTQALIGGKKRLRNAGSKINWGAVVDEHPTPETTVSIYEAALTRLIKIRGGEWLNVRPTPLEQEHPLREAAREAQHSSTLRRFMDERGYGELSAGKKLAVLAEFISCADYIRGQRLKDLKREIREIRLHADAVTLDKKEGLAALAEAIFELPLRDNLTAATALYGSASWLVTRSLNTVPLGRLEKIAGAVSDFVNAKDCTEAREKATALISLCRDEPLLKCTDGAKFLQGIKWPNFEYPYIPEKTRKKEHRPIVSWNEHVKFVSQGWGSRSGNPVLKALLLLGVDDFRLYEYFDSITAVELFAHRLQPLSQGPCDGSDTIDSLEIFPSGRARLQHKDKDDLLRFKNNYREQVLRNLAGELFAKIPEDPSLKSEIKSIERALKEHTSSKAARDVSIRRLRATDHRLIALDNFHFDPELFVQLNSDDLPFYAAQRAVREKLLQLKSADRELYQKTIKAFFIACRQANYSDIEFVPVGNADARSASFSESPLISLVLEQGSTEWSVEEKLEILTVNVNWGYLLSCGYEADDYDESMVPTQNTAFTINSILNEVRPLLAGIIPEVPLSGPKTWKELSEIAATPAFAALPIAPRYIELECGRMLIEPLMSNSSGRVRRPTAAQIHLFLEHLRKIEDLYGYSVSYIKEQFREVISKSKDLWSKDLKTALHEWKRFFEANILPSEKRFEYLGRLLSEVEALPDNKAKNEMFESLIADPDVRILDPDYRNRAIKGWARAMRGAVGIDDGSERFRASVLEIAQRVKDKVPEVDLSQLFNALAKEVQAQHALSQELKSFTQSLSGKKLEESHFAFLGGEAVVVAIHRKEALRMALLKFLIDPLSKKSCSELSDIMEEEILYDSDQATSRPKRLEDLRLFHKNFWSAVIEVRAVLARELLIPPTMDDRLALDNAFNFALEKTFPAKKEYSEQAQKFVRAYLDSVPDFARPLGLAALMVAAEKTANSERGTGFAIATFLEIMGPAETKAGQAAQSHPNTPKAIRDDLARLKTQADEPPRWEVTDLIEKAVPDETRARIKHIGDILGSASLFIAVEVEMNDGSKQVLSLLRPHALERAKFGFKVMADMAHRLGKDDLAFETLVELINDAKALAEDETNTALAVQQRITAHGVYDGVKIVDGAKEVRFYAPRLVERGDGYLLSERVPGAHFIDLPDGAEKRALARCILTLELNNILSGRPFDSDRHGGNCRIENGVVGHFDFGAMMLVAPDKEELATLARYIVQALSNCETTSQFAERYFDELKKSRGEGVPIDHYLMRVQKALLSLGEYLEVLSDEDKRDVLISALQEIHPVVTETAMMEASSILSSGKGFSPALTTLGLAGAGPAPIKIVREV